MNIFALMATRFSAAVLVVAILKAGQVSGWDLGRVFRRHAVYEAIRSSEDKSSADEEEPGCGHA